MNQNVKRNKFVAAIFAMFFSAWGLHRFYMGKIDGLLYILFNMTFIPQIIGFIEGIHYLTMSDEVFQSKCNNNNQALNKLANYITPSNNINSNSSVYNAVNLANNSNPSPTQVTPKNETKTQIPVTRENVVLANNISKAQDRLERMKSNDFYIQDNNVKIDKRKEREQLKELKDHGLIDEAEYRQRLRKL